MPEALLCCSFMLHVLLPMLGEALCDRRCHGVSLVAAFLTGIAEYNVFRVIVDNLNRRLIPRSAFVKASVQLCDNSLNHRALVTCNRKGRRVIRLGWIDCNDYRNLLFNERSGEIG